MLRGLALLTRAAGTTAARRWSRFNRPPPRSSRRRARRLARTRFFDIKEPLFFSARAHAAWDERRLWWRWKTRVNVCVRSWEKFTQETVGGKNLTYYFVKHCDSLVDPAYEVLP